MSPHVGGRGQSPGRGPNDRPDARAPGASSTGQRHCTCRWVARVRVQRLAQGWCQFPSHLKCPGTFGAFIKHVKDKIIVGKDH